MRREIRDPRGYLSKSVSLANKTTVSDQCYWQIERFRETTVRIYTLIYPLLCLAYDKDCIEPKRMRIQYFAFKAKRCTINVLLRLVLVAIVAVEKQ